MTAAMEYVSKRGYVLPGIMMVAMARVLRKGSALEIFMMMV